MITSYTTEVDRITANYTALRTASLTKLETLQPGDLVVFAATAFQHTAPGSELDYLCKNGKVAMYLGQTKHRASLAHLSPEEMQSFARDGCCDLLMPKYVYPASNVLPIFNKSIEIIHCIWFNKLL